MMTLRPYQASDAEEIVKWIADERAMRKWSAHWYGHFPVTADDMNALYERMTNQVHPEILTAVDTDGITGHLILRMTDEEKRIIRAGFVIVNDRKRGRGCGKQLMELAVQYAFEMLNAETVSLGVFENNLPALKCYQSAGFRVVETDEPEYFEAFGEKWKCLQMERRRCAE